MCTPHFQPHLPAQQSWAEAELLSIPSVSCPAAQLAKHSLFLHGPGPCSPYKGSNPGSTQVQWCQKTQETALNSQILNTKRFPAALHPPWALTRLRNSLFSTFPMRRVLEVALLQCLPPVPGVTSSVPPAVPSLIPLVPMDVTVTLLMSAHMGLCTCFTLSRCRPPQGLQGLLSILSILFHPLAGVKHKQVFLHCKSDV